MREVSAQGRFFLDTNVLVYAFDGAHQDKREIARKWLTEALRSRQGVISTQIVQEFLNVALRKFAKPITLHEAKEILHDVLLPLCHHRPASGFYELALLLKEETNFSFYDTLVVAAAIELQCDNLLSEDLQEGRVLYGVTIVNPFSEVQANRTSR